VGLSVKLVALGTGSRASRSAGMTKVRVVVPEFRNSEISGTQGREVSAEFVALGPGSRAAARGRDDNQLVTHDP
jgi:hypothetical protein